MTGAQRWRGSWLLSRTGPSLVVIRVHLLAPVTLRQHEMAWYQLFFQFAGVAQATVMADDWAWLRMFSRGDGDIGQWIEELSRPGALTAALNWARANLAPRMPGPQPGLPPVQAPGLASGRTATATSTASGCGSQRPGWRGRGATRRSRALATGCRGTPPASSTTCCSTGCADRGCPPRSAAGTARHPVRTGRQGDIDHSEEGHRDDASANAHSPQFRIIGGLSIRFAERGGRNDDALPLRFSGRDRQGVVTGLAAASAVGGAAAGAPTGRDAT